LLLYNSQVSGNCYKVRLLLAHLGIEYERRELTIPVRPGRDSSSGRRSPSPARWSCKSPPR